MKFPTQQNREFLQRNGESGRENREFERAIEQSDFRMMYSEGTTIGQFSGSGIRFSVHTTEQSDVPETCYACYFRLCRKQPR